MSGTASFVHPLHAAAAASAAVPPQPQAHPPLPVWATAFEAFITALESLCIAAGPPAPSFSQKDIDTCINHILPHSHAYPAAFGAIDRRLSLDSQATPISVRAMLFSLLARFVERTWNATPRRDEWCNLLAPQLYRIVMLILPRTGDEDGSANVGLTRTVLTKWINLADAGAGSGGGTAVAAPFKRHQLLNAIKYVEGYTYEPPQPTEAELMERKERKRAKKRARREADERSRKKQRREQQRTPDSASRNSSPRSPNSATAESPSRSRSGSRSSSRSRSGSRSPSPAVSPARLRYLNRTSVSHTASEEAAASRLLEHLRASQKRLHTEASLRPIGESYQGWEEWEETRRYCREKRQRQEKERQKSEGAAAAAAALSSASTVAASASASASSSTSSSSTTIPPQPATPISTPSSLSSSSSLISFLTSWLAPRNHWRATRDNVGELDGDPSPIAQHETDQWYAYYQSNGLILPSHTIPQGAMRTWNKLNQTDIERHEGPLIPPPPPTKLYQRTPQ